MTAVDMILQTYNNCLAYLGIVHTNEEQHNKPSYNVWLTPRMMFVVLREKNSVEGAPAGEDTP
jgi:ATP adenylyltransferase/5',5'''-P-1,P-4-tetraphosphate phosphorylase II